VFLVHVVAVVRRQLVRRDVEASAQAERQRLELRRAHLGLQVDDIAADEAETDLGRDKPEPLDALVTVMVIEEVAGVTV